MLIGLHRLSEVSFLHCIVSRLRCDGFSRTLMNTCMVGDICLSFCLRQKIIGCADCLTMQFVDVRFKIQGIRFLLHSYHYRV